MTIRSVIRRTGLRRASLAAVVLLGMGIPAVASPGAVETETVDRTVAIAAGGTLTVDNFSGQVRISGTDRQDVSVHAVRRAPRERLNRIALDVQSDGQNVSVRANKRDSDAHGNDNVVETDLTIEVPRGTNLRVTTFSSPLEVTDVAGSRHVFKSFSGALRFDRVTAPIEAETFSATIEGTLTAEASRQVQLRTFSGDIEVRLAPETSGPVEFVTFSGGFDSDVPLALSSKSGKTIRGHLGQGTRSDASLRFKTFSGSVRLLR
jgi:DUF4097 and DUF4098 domain-containing protein YvlB